MTTEPIVKEAALVICLHCLQAIGLVDLERVPFLRTVAHSWPMPGEIPCPGSGQPMRVL